MTGHSRESGLELSRARTPDRRLPHPLHLAPPLRLALPVALLAIGACLVLALWPAGPPALYSLFPGLAGLRTPACESGRVLVLTDPPLEGDDVTEVQETLRKFGLYDGDVDGVFGTETAAAVTLFRMEHNLSRVPRVDTAFWRAVSSQWLSAQPAGTADQAAAAEPPAAEGRMIIINIEKMRLTFYAGGYPYKSFPVAVGKPSTPSAVGQWRIRNKGINVGPPFGTRWHGLSVPWGIYGVHGTNNPGSIGSQASGGCIRMFNWNVEELYEWTEVGTPVIIIAPHWPALVRPSLPEGCIGQSVVFLQWQMQRLHWYTGEADGRLQQRTVESIRDMEAFYGFKVDGLAGTDILCLLDLGG